MEEFVELQLRGGGEGLDQTAAAASVWKPLVQNILRIVCEVDPASVSKDSVELRARLNEHRVTLASPLHPQEERQAAAACVKTCDQYLRHMQQDLNARDAELGDMIRMLREAATRLLGDSSDFHAQLLSSADRFKRMNRLDDIRQLKDQLSAEVASLERAVETKKQRDAEIVKTLSQRVESLTADLVKAEEQASCDPLTKIPNRGAFDRTLPAMMTAALRHDTPLTLAMIDVDHFKKVNDDYGHQVGDRVLLCTAEWLQSSIRHSDFVARYGGEEFVVLLHGANVSQAEVRFGKVLAEIAERSYEYQDNGEARSVRFTVSCGVAQLMPNDTAQELIHRADQALYEAKQRGRNRVVAKKVSRLSRFLHRQ